MKIVLAVVLLGGCDPGAGSEFMRAFAAGQRQSYQQNQQQQRNFCSSETRCATEFGDYVCRDACGAEVRRCRNEFGAWVCRSN